MYFHFIDGYGMLFCSNDLQYFDMTLKYFTLKYANSLFSKCFTLLSGFLEGY